MRLLFLQTLVMLLFAGTGSMITAEPTTSTPDHAAILRQMPAAFLGRTGSVPDANGFVGYNRNGFKAASFQRGATVTLALAAARADQRLAENCWRAVDATFAHQTEAGDFGDPAESVAFWLCELSRALLVIQQSTLAPQFQERIEALKPKLARAAQWLAGQRERLQREDRAAPNRLFFDAEGFLFCSRLLNDAALGKIGREFLEQGMKLYRAEDGVFLEHNGGDSSYQAVNLLRLQEIVLHFPDPKVEEAIAKGMQWEVARIGADGAVSTEGNTRVFSGGEKFMGHEKQVNVGEIALALLYFHGRTGDPAALAAVERLYQHYATKR
jgi:hypothetical protein